MEKNPTDNYMVCCFSTRTQTLILYAAFRSVYTGCIYICVDVYICIHRSPTPAPSHPQLYRKTSAKVAHCVLESCTFNIPQAAIIEVQVQNLVFRAGKYQIQYSSWKVPKLVFDLESIKSDFQSETYQICFSSWEVKLRMGVLDVIHIYFQMKYIMDVFEYWCCREKGAYLLHYRKLACLFFYCYLLANWC